MTRSHSVAVPAFSRYPLVVREGSLRVACFDLAMAHDIIKQKMSLGVIVVVMFSQCSAVRAQNYETTDHTGEAYK